MSVVVSAVVSGPRALAMSALLVAALGDPAAADLSKEFFGGVYAPYTKVTQSDDSGPNETGMGIGLEAGWQLAPPISISLSARRSLLSDTFFADPGRRDFRSRQLVASARVDLWPLPRRLRMGVAIGRSWDRYGSRAVGEGDFSENDRSRTLLEAHLGVVVLRWRSFELEVQGSHAGIDLGHGDTKQVFSAGVGVRWRGDLGATSSSGARRSSPAPASTAAR